MLDYCGEIEFYPYDGDNDNYNSYEPNLGGVDFVRATKYNSQSLQSKKDPFITDNNYYHHWTHFDKLIERDTCYSILRNDMWMNIPKKIVRAVKEHTMFVHMQTFRKIETTAYEKTNGDPCCLL